MRKIIGVMICIAAVGGFAGEAAAITDLTKDQVRNVCGPDLKKSNGHFGCTKKCADKKSTCIYDCSEKTGVCSGVAMVR